MNGPRLVGGYMMVSYTLLDVSINHERYSVRLRGRKRSMVG